MRRGHRVAVIGVLVGVVVGLSSPASASDNVRPEDRGGRRTPAVGNATGAFGNALRLARMLGDDRTIARLLAARALVPAAAPGEVAEAAEALENLGEPDQAAELLRSRLNRFPKERQTGIALAQLLARDGQSAAAADVWKRLDAQKEPKPLRAAQVVEWARDLARTGRQDEAFAVLRAHTAGVQDDDADFWDDLATLAWEREDDEVAFQVYRRTWQADPRRANVAPRLMNLARDRGDIDLACRVALDDYASTHEPTTLLFVVGLYRDRGRWSEARSILAIADADPATFAKRVDYWLLRAEVYKQLRDPKTAYAAYRAALALRPTSPEAQAALVWHDLDGSTPQRLAQDLASYRASAAGSEELWKPYALGLDKLGRPREALQFYARTVRAHPEDDEALFGLADSLEHTGYAALADRARRRITGRWREQALAILRKADASTDDLGKLAAYIERVRAVAGMGAGDRLLRAALAAHPRSPEITDLALSTYAGEGRTATVRRMLSTRARLESSGSWGKEKGADKLDEIRLSLAIDEDDYGEVRRRLSEGKGVGAEMRANAADLLERDDLEAESLRAAIASENPEAEHAELARRWLEIRDRHLPSVDVGGSYYFINGLSALGPDASVEHDAGAMRVAYSAFGRTMSNDDGTLVLGQPRLEADFGVALRGGDPRATTVGGVGFNYQPGSPLPRASFVDERLLGPIFSTRIEAAFDEHIDDTAFLRLEGVRDRLTLGVRADLARFYSSVGVEGIEDHTRQFNNLSLGLEENVEAGFKLLRGEPEWDVALQATFVQRSNVSPGSYPSDVQSVIPAKPDYDLFLPPSYQMLGVVTHFLRGDFAARLQRDRSTFPRYDCDAEGGILFPSDEGTVLGQCSISVRVAGSGWISAIGIYLRGVAGIANDTNALAALSYTQPL